MKKIIAIATVLLGLSGGVYAGPVVEQLNSSSGTDGVTPVPAVVGVKAVASEKYSCNGYLGFGANTTEVELGVLTEGVASTGVIRSFRFSAIKEEAGLVLMISRTGDRDFGGTAMMALPKLGDPASLSMHTAAEGLVRILCGVVGK